jgi:hypothetical protein
MFLSFTPLFQDASAFCEERTHSMYRKCEQQRLHTRASERKDKVCVWSVCVCVCDTRMHSRTHNLAHTPYPCKCHPNPGGRILLAACCWICVCVCVCV